MFLTLIRRNWPLALVPFVAIYFLALLIPSVIYSTSGTDTYWLLIALDYHNFPMNFWIYVLLIMLALFEIGLLWGTVRLWVTQRPLSIVMGVVSLLVTPFLLFGLLLSTSSYTPLASTSFEGHVYHLADYNPGSDSALYLYQCDTIGFFCRAVDFTLISDPAYLFSASERSYALRGDTNEHQVIILIDNLPIGTFQPQA